MKGIILNEIKSGYFTNMKDVLIAMNDAQKDYNWLISDYECNVYPSNKILFNTEYAFVDGDTLTDIIYQNDIDFIWGVFSGFQKNISKDEILQYKLPFADGNTKLWNEKIKIQNPLADIEIVSWDSSLLLLIAKQEIIINNFLQHYPNALDLEDYNSNSK